MKTIEFFSTMPGVADAFPIAPAKNFRPKWMQVAKDDYIKTINERQDKFNHIYQCPGIFELYRHGFIVPMWYDALIVTDKNKRGFGFITPTNDLQQDGRILIDKHDDKLTQMIPPRPHSLPFIVKINTPWNIIAPKGVKFLMMPITYPDSHEFENAIGILDPGVSCEINFQLWWNIKDGETLLKAGTPMVHLIPLSPELYDVVCRDMTEHDKTWINKRKYLQHFSFRPKRNLIKEFYYKHFR
jgi:hypothetical protein